MGREDNSITFEFFSYWELAFERIEESRRFLAKFITDSEIVGIQVILRELLLNAVIHGNKSNKGLLVRCSVEHLGHKRFKIAVEDEGNGFDRMNVAVDVQDLQDPIRRTGYFLINRLSESIEFNDRGNRVTVYHDARIG